LINIFVSKTNSEVFFAAVGTGDVFHDEVNRAELVIVTTLIVRTTLIVKITLIPRNSDVSTSTNKEPFETLD
jgi:hypothetical protein